MGLQDNLNSLNGEGQRAHRGTSRHTQYCERFAADLAAGRNQMEEAGLPDSNCDFIDRLRSRISAARPLHSHRGDYAAAIERTFVISGAVGATKWCWLSCFSRGCSQHQESQRPASRDLEEPDRE